MNQLNVKTSKVTFILLGLLGLIFIPLSLGSLIVSMQNRFSLTGIMLGFAMLAMFGFIVWIVLRGHFKSVKYFTDWGLIRNDGRRFNWVNLSHVVYQVRYNHSLKRKSLWRTEIRFKDNSAAWLIPSKVSNFQEIDDFVGNLPCEHVEQEV
jgi:hypothetical protein